MPEACQVCSSTEWWDLPDPVRGRSVTTAGRLIDEPLGKAQCGRCGFVQRIHAQFLGSTDYYEEHYANYYAKPGSTRHHTARYRVVADWVASAVEPLAPKRILDVGCGQGWAMEAMKAAYPQAEIEGIEPSHFNSDVARERGFVVHEGRLGEAALPETPYDLVYCNNVIQHVMDARKFVAALTPLVTADGVIVMTCPNAAVPNIEMLWADQNFSFLPLHLIQLAEDTGFETIRWFSSPRSPSVPPAQLILISRGRTATETRPAKPQVPGLNDLYEAKCEYLKTFPALDGYLWEATRGRSRIFNMGASYWSSVLAAYCPRYWHDVTACLVDVPDGSTSHFTGKDVVATSSVIPGEDDTVVLGTSPATHAELRDKLSPAWRHVVAWDGWPVRF